MTKLPIDSPWRPNLNWDTQAGRVLSSLIDELGKTEGDWLVNVFGSAPLQMAYAHDFLSADVDTSVGWGRGPEFDEVIERLGLSRGQAELYIQSCHEAAFRTSPKWKDRAFCEIRGRVTLRFAHPLDILIGKLHRLDTKDFKAFHLVRALTGEPTEETMIRELQAAPDLFSLAFMLSQDQKPFAHNVEELWRVLYEREIDVRQEILAPAQTKLNRDYDLGANEKSALGEIGETTSTPPEEQDLRE